MPENPPVLNNESGSLSESLGLRSPVDITMTGSERAISVLARKVEELSKELHEVKKERILDETQLPPEILEQLGFSQTPPPRLKRGRGYRPLLSPEIQDAKKALEAKHPSINEAMVARYLGVNYFTYKRYAKMYGLWNPKPNVRGERNIFDPERGKYPLNEILLGKYPEYPVFRIKDKLIRSGTKQAKCELCGFHEKRVMDGKMPLVLNFMDGNEKNHTLENIKLYCYNCTFTSGKGYIRRGIHHFDPDWMQGSKKFYAEEGVRY